MQKREQPIHPAESSEAFGFSEAILDAAGKVGLRKIEQIVETPCVGKDAIELSLMCANISARGTARSDASL
jgi:hypothetical protein